MQLVGKNNIPKFTTDEKWKIKIGRKVLKGRKMESLFWFDNGWKLENGGSHQISKAQTMYDEKVWWNWS